MIMCRRVVFGLVWMVWRIFMLFSLGSLRLSRMKVGRLEMLWFL